MIFKVVIALWLIVFVRAQIVLDGTPNSLDIYTEETTSILVDGDPNSINGAACVQSFTLSSTSPSQPTWASNNVFDLTFSPPDLAAVGIFELQYEVVETGVGSCNFVPHNRRITISVMKRKPIVNYDVPDYNTLRAVVPFDIEFPQPVCSDPHSSPLVYNLVDQSDLSVSNQFTFDTSGNGKISGTISNAQAGTYYLRIYCVDTINQRIRVDFTMHFSANNNPVRVATDMTPYEFVVPQGVTTQYILPVGLYVDSDGDSITYELAYYETFAALSSESWATFYQGIEGVAYLEFTTPDATSTHTGFNFMLSDGIGSTTGPVLIGFTFNKSPDVNQTVLDIAIYPNNTFTQELELQFNSGVEGHFSDPESAALTYSSKNVDAAITVTGLTTSKFKLEADFSSSFPSSTISLTFSASDGVSASTDMIVNLQPSTWSSEWSSCFGSTSSEWYSCSGVYVLSGTTCQASCPAEHYSVSNVCYSCHANWSTCTQSACTLWKNSFFLKSGFCETNWGTGYFGYNKECYTCSSNCNTCTGELQTECTECSVGYVFVGSACTQVTCLDDEYLQASTCQNCDVSCKTCSNSGNDQCTECAKGYRTSAGRWIYCTSLLGLTVDEFGNCVDETPAVCDCPNGFTCDVNGNCIEVAGPKCELATLQGTLLVLTCERNVIVLNNSFDSLFRFTVEGPRGRYDFKVKLSNTLKIMTPFKTLTFNFEPYSTYIGLNEEKLKLTFPNPQFIVSETDNSFQVANTFTIIDIYDRSDAIPESTDLLSKILSYVVGLGSIVGLIMSSALKCSFGSFFNLGWGLINFIQIIAFIPLADFYFPGNVRGYVSFLKIANTAGQGLPNIFYLFIDKDQLELKPYNYRFEVMSIDTTIFIENCGWQISIFLLLGMMVMAINLIDALMTKYDRFTWVRNKIVRPINKHAINLNTLIKSIIMVYMFLFLSSLMTTIQLNFDNGHEVGSFMIGTLFFLLSILFIFMIFTAIQYFYKEIEGCRTFRNSIKSLTQDLRYDDGIFSRFYIPIYLLRRVVFMTIIVAFDNFYLLLGHCVIALAVVVILRPYEMRSQNFVLIFNEMMITILMGVSGVFTKKDMHNDTALNWGWVWIAIATFTIVANWAIWIVLFVKSILDKKLKKKVAADEPKQKDISKNEKRRGSKKVNSDDPEDRNDVNDNPGIDPSSRFAIMSPTKQKEDHGFQVHNIFEDWKEEQKVDPKYLDPVLAKIEDEGDIDEQFGYEHYSPTIETSASPKKNYSTGSISDGSTDGVFWIIKPQPLPEAIPYPKSRSKKSHSRKFSEGSDMNSESGISGDNQRKAGSSKDMVWRVHM